ncbi:MAG TPA: AlkA N-terminal domain-containing protein, partial [Myxococcota bacterium]|nr:AlkA N-terminal domain-containing protein [Myxococcota bacterium]
MESSAAAATLDDELCWRALRARDARFDGRFFTAVRSTGIYCRPICPARTPKREHCVFLPSAAAAHEAGYRPCLRCRPEVAPELAAARGTSSTVTRALRLIAEGALDGDDVHGLAARLGVGERHLRRLFDRCVGASPIAVAQTRRVLFAKQLLDETALPITEIAFAAGFGSLRRFHATMQRTYGRPPRALRRGRARAPSKASGLALRLPFRPPLDWGALTGFLAARAIPGVEQVADGIYRRSFLQGEAQGTVEVRAGEDGRHLVATLRLTRVAALPAIVARLRQLFDLDADVAAIGAHLARDRALAVRLRAHGGVRVPGALDPFELAVRAILGQQVSVAAATRLAGRLVEAFGTPLDAGLVGSEPGAPRFLFPTPARLADADVARIGMPRARARAISSLAAAVCRDPELLCGSRDLERAVERLSSLPGVGGWTAHYVAMRALREPDAFPASDLGLRRELASPERRPTSAELLARAEAWRPWRAYAAILLWTCAAPEPARRHR